MSEQDRSAGETVAYVDESVEDSYVLTAVVVRAAAQPDVRATLRAALLPGQRRLHWHTESPARRDGLAAMVEDLGCPAVAVIGAPVDRRRQDRARRKCMETLLWEVGDHRVDQVRVESGGPVRDRADTQVLAGFRASAVLAPSTRFEHGLPEQDEGLWLPDIVAGAVLAGVRGTTGIGRCSPSCGRYRWCCAEHARAGRPPSGGRSRLRFQTPWTWRRSLSSWAPPGRKLRWAGRCAV